MSHVRVAILISGSGSNMVELVKSMAGDHPARACIVVSNQPDAKGLNKAEALGVSVLAIDHTFFDSREAFEDALHDALVDAGAEIICLAGFMRVLSPGIVRKWQGKILNIHPSILPLFKGLDTHARALEAGMAVHGCTVHIVTPELDDGPILGQAVIPVEDGDTPETLAARLLGMEHRLYPAVLRRFAAGDRRKLALM